MRAIHQLCQDLGKISLDRPLTSYSRVQKAYSAVARNAPWQLARLDIATRPYLNIGCGPFPKPGYVNLDYTWVPGVDLCWDVTKGLPLPGESLEGIFSEHCLEHIPRAACQKVFSEARRLLKPGRAFRLVLPDAELHIRIYTDRKKGNGGHFPYEAEADASLTPMMWVNEIFRAHGHLFAYDFETVARMLTEAGFRNVERADYLVGRDPKLLIDQEWRARESLYVEAY